MISISSIRYFSSRINLSNTISLFLSLTLFLYFVDFNRVFGL